MEHGRTAIRRSLLVGAVLLTTLAGLAGTASAGAAPANNQFAQRTPIHGTTTTVTGNNIGATVQADEPSPSCCTAENTVWWSWTATFTGAALVDTVGSDFDTQAAVYTGASLASLTEVGSNDDDAAGDASRIEFAAVQGTQYQIQVDGFQSASGTIRLRVNPVTFNDVGRTHPFWRDVEWVSANDVAQGFQDGGYHPQANISRGAMSAFLYRLAGEPFVIPGPPTFSDVGLTHPFFTEVEWMNDQQITTGYPDGTYKPGAPVSRGAMAAFIYRFDGASYDPPETASFSDVGIGHPFFTEVEWMDDLAITTGYPDGTYRPAAPVTRAAMAAFLHRYETLPL